MRNQKRYPAHVMQFLSWLFTLQFLQEHTSEQDGEDSRAPKNETASEHISFSKQNENSTATAEQPKWQRSNYPGIPSTRRAGRLTRAIADPSSYGTYVKLGVK